MSTLVLGSPPPELKALGQRRRQAGVDRLDEVWQGVLHMVPGPSLAHALISQQLAELFGPLARAAGLLATMSEFNLGDSEQGFRVPDGGLHRPGATGTWLPTAAVVVEIVSEGDGDLAEAAVLRGSRRRRGSARRPDQTSCHLARAA